MTWEQTPVLTCPTVTIDPDSWIQVTFVGDIGTHKGISITVPYNHTSFATADISQWTKDQLGPFQYSLVAYMHYGGRLVQSHVATGTMDCNPLPTTTTTEQTTTTTVPTVITLPCEKEECVHGSTTTTVQPVPRCGENGVQCPATSTSFIGTTSTTQATTRTNLPNTGSNDGPIAGSALILIVLGAIAAVKMRKKTRV